MINVSEILDKVKAFFNRISDPDKIQEYIQGHKKEMIVLCIVLVVVLCSLCLLIVTSPEVRPERNRRKTEEIIIPLQDSLFLPEEPGLTDQFQFYRERRDVWTREDAEEWFSVPTEEMLEQLENTNNNVISDILGAAP